MKIPLHSLRWRLQLWHALISLVLIVAACLLADRLVTRERFEGIKRELFDFERSFFTHGLADHRPNDSKDTPPTLQMIKQALQDFSLSKEAAPPSFLHLFEDDPRKPYIAYWGEDGSNIFRAANTPPRVTAPADVAERYRWEEGQENKNLLLTRSHRSGLKILVGRDISDDLAALTRFRLLLALGGSAIFLVALAGGWWLAGRALVPIDTIALTASRIADGNLDERIEIDESDSELNRLAAVLNGTFDKLSDSIERQKRFTADASHELRTPLTIILSETQRGLRHERNAESYRGIIANCQTAAERMRRLVDSLLQLAREDLTNGSVELVDLADIAFDAARELSPLADAHQSRLTLDITPAQVEGTAADLETLTHTLLSNALTHTPPGTPVTLRTKVVGEEVILTIHDQGPGIPSEHLPHLCDRFYQVDKARSQSQNHSGLGLSIAQSISRKLGGSLTITSDDSNGTTAKVSLPKS
ncbi:ATP-binding protein [Roseibacillus persicicus]|uniref:ATP-binding protein n=1 Tax=Roseibacillus persicicus TaxID=454148 RepID=UPI00280D77D3|nr:ATP-binding protein [Roseibacillus persicicus]MDQ8188983.1 ATP-binding protein [Roseibacillus persicicus]